MDGMGRDVRDAARSLARSPSFTAIAVLTLALGIGANTAIFSVVREVLLRPLPYDEPDRLVLVWAAMTTRGVTDFPHSPPDLKDYRDHATVFQDLSGMFTFPQALTGDGEPQQVQAGIVTEDFFRVLGVRPALGRDFLPEDHVPGAPGALPGQPGALNNSVILGHGLWTQRFGGDPGVVGRIVDLGGTPSEIVGVLPPGFRLHLPPGKGLGRDSDLYVAARIDPAQAQRGNVFLTVLGRLRPGVTPGQAQEEMERLAARQREIFWDDVGFRLDVVPLHEDLVAGVRPVLVALLGAVAFVLLIACANVGNLLLVRGAARERELSIRAALGGSRSRIVRQLLAESALIAAAGAAGGVALAAGGVRLLLALRPPDLPRMDDVALDGTVLAFAVAAAGAAALLFGILPSVRASRVDLAGSLKERSGTPGAGGQRLVRSGVVVAEVALSLVLLVGAGLMVRSFVALARTDPGFEVERLLTFSLNLPPGRYPTTDDRVRFWDQLRDRIEALPGVEAATGAFPLPLDGGRFNGRYGDLDALTDPEAFRQADYRTVLPGYFETLGTRLLAGRTFTDADQADSTSVAVVDELLAQRLWPEEPAVGRRFVIRMTGPEPQEVEVIGVVENQRHESLATGGRETVFVTDRWSGSFGSLRWAVRTTGDPPGVVDAVRGEVGALDPLLPVSEVRTMASWARDHAAETRFALLLVGTFAALALVLSVVGLYGVLSHLVRQRTAEIGVRMAFGAHAAGILRLVLGQGMALAALGVALGAVAAAGLTRLMTGFLVGVTPHDPLTFLSVAALFLAVAALAVAVPARRAARLDPVAALREE